MKASLHDRIRGAIETAIMAGDLRPGDRLPTERELMIEHGCARMTVSKALSSLTASGLIERRKRAGSFVAQPRVHSMVLDIPDLQQEVVQRGHAYRFDLIGRCERSAERNSDEEVQLAGGGTLLALEGIHTADGRPLAYEQRLVSLAAVPDIAGQSFDMDSPGSWLLGHVPWTEAETRIAAIPAVGEIAARLDLAPGTACLLVERRTWRGDTGITLVRQTFVGSAYDLVAWFSPAREPAESRSRPALSAS